MLTVVKSLLKASGVELRRYPLFTRAIELLVREGPPPFFVQVGANNGIDFDDFYSLVERFHLSGVVVEPIPYYFATLKEAYKRHTNVAPVQAALHPTDSEAIIYRVDPAAGSWGWEHGLSSFNRDHLLKNNVPESAILAERVPCLSFSELLRQQARQTVDILISDTEGFDGEILKMVDLATMKPKVVKFESKHLSPDELAGVNHRFSQAGFLVQVGAEDTVAVSKPLASRLRYLQAAMRAG